MNYRYRFRDEEGVIRETCEIFKSQGVNGLIKYVTHDLNKWKQVKINFAVTGNSGAGISSLINALRGLHQWDQNAATEGVKETTREPASYTFPDNDHIVFYDLPGVGTLSHPIESYMQDMKLYQYDLVLIVSSHRFSENDALIIKELESVRKPFYLVRSKIFADVKNQKFTQTKAAVLKIIRDDCTSHLQKLGVNEKRVFLIDSHVHQDFQLKDLQMALIHDAPDSLKESLILTFRTLTKEIIWEKVKVLKLRALSVAFLAIVSAQQGAKYSMNEIVLKDEISFYKTELGLDDEALGNTCKDLKVDRTRLQEMIAFCDIVVYPEKAIEYINKFELVNLSLKYSILLLCFERTFTGFVSTYSKVYYGLLHIIDTLEKDSLKISEIYLEKIRGLKSNLLHYSIHVNCFKHLLA